MRKWFLHSQRVMVVFAVILLVGNSADGTEPPRRSPQERMMEALSLTSEQKAQWVAAFAGLEQVAANRSQYTRDEFFAKLREEGKKAGTKLNEILTPAQRTLYDQIKNARLAEAAGKKGAQAPTPFKRLLGSPSQP